MWVVVGIRTNETEGHPDEQGAVFRSDLGDQCYLEFYIKVILETFGSKRNLSYF